MSVAGWRTRPVPADVLLHPLSLAATAALLLNDHVLKARWPGVFTGKLSDAAAMILCPVLVAAAVEVVQWVAVRRLIPLSPRAAIGVGLAVAGGFAAMKAWPTVGGFYGSALGALRGVFGFSFDSVSVAADPTDAVAVAMVPLAVWCLMRRASRHHGTFQDNPT